MSSQIEKLFDISCTLSDVVKYVPYKGPKGDAQTPHEYLNQLLNLISRLRGGASRYVPLLMSKVRENLPNMSNPLTHMPLTLDAFMEGSTSDGSSPREVTKQQSNMRQPPSQEVQIPSPARSCTFAGLARQQSFNDSVHTPQMQHTPQQERLMFETYSPSIASHSHSDPGMTPPLYAEPHQQYAHHPTSHPVPPRSAPLSTSKMKQEPWEGYHG